MEGQCWQTFISWSGLQRPAPSLTLYLCLLPGQWESGSCLIQFALGQVSFMLSLCVSSP